ncbi:hypothetical protein CROQUDRAFT_682693 [Cronartium quercuum f. sp. fusiforme G11]|uniref:Uncharacterized protein n=1 Tax=Cronartium quercuum f. sp. fusiforme G11 TaxID=708437 RepID=A0A9P6NV20_9BASI|nr:hypothetical protein CROQUDRAFT_682693 [Cronartium quercuum f. sp. fusiforme G11]
MRVSSTSLLTRVFALLMLSYHNVESFSYVSERLSTDSLSIKDGPKLPKDAAAYNLTVPEGLQLKYLGIGFGTQNYTCSLVSGTPNWNPVGAVAELRDLTGITTSPVNIAREAIRKEAQSALASYPHLATHYFVAHDPAPLPGFFFEPNKDEKRILLSHQAEKKIDQQRRMAFTGNSHYPEVTSASQMKYETSFTSELKYGLVRESTGTSEVGGLPTEKGKFIIAAKMGSIPSPDDPTQNVPWLALKGIEGDAARFILRTDTQLGVAPSLRNCIFEGQEANIRYSALYWFYM